MNIEIIRLLPEHSLSYRKIRLESLKLHPYAFETSYEESLQQKELFFEKQILEQDENNFVVGAFKDKSLIGICGFINNNRYKLEQTGSIVQMYVKQHFCGQKIAQRLLYKVEQMALSLKSVSRIMLEVNKNNKRAINLYQNCGYKELGVDNTISTHLLCMTR